DSHGNPVPFTFQYKAHILSDIQVTLRYQIQASDGQIVMIEEQPEYIEADRLLAGLERRFAIKGLRQGYRLRLNMQFGLSCQDVEVSGGGRFIQQVDPMQADPETASDSVVGYLD